MQKEWSYKKPAPEKFRNQFPEFSPFVQDLLWQRGFHTAKDIDKFFNPDYERDTHDPHLLKDIDKAVSRIHKAIEQKELIVLYGDYDTDGVSALIILVEALEKLEYSNFSIYIPDRAKEGHGLQMEAVKKFVVDGVKLIVTVDCGITNIKEVTYAQEHGVDVVVTDHHQIIEKNPAYAVVDPHQKEDSYPFPDICGTTVAFKVAQVLLEGRIKKGWDRWLLDLVALATVTDMMPLIDENRAFLKYGLYVLAHQRRIGLKELMRISNIKPKVSKEGISTNLNARALGFAIGPRVNAAGRVDHANTAFALLNAKTKEEAREYALKLDKANIKRQKIIEDIVKDLMGREKEFAQGKVIISGSDKWPVGVLGIVAGKLTGQYNKPVFLYEIRGTEFKGSARSVPEFNIVEALTSVGEHLRAFGGHPQAGGFTGDIKKEGKFKEALSAYADKIFVNGIAPPSLSIDLRVKADQITWPFFHDLAKLEPFGQKNPIPILAMDNLSIVSVRTIGNGKKHLLFRVRDENGKQWKALFFGSAESHSYLAEGNTISIAFELDIDEWQGRRELMMKIVDIKE